MTVSATCPRFRGTLPGPLVLEMKCGENAMAPRLSPPPPLVTSEERKNMTNELKESSKGWTPERRAAQAARMHARKPWLKSTGPRTHAGKRTARLNATKHGHRSAKMRELSRLLRAQQRFIARWRGGNYHPPKRRFLWSMARNVGVAAAYRRFWPANLSRSPHWRDQSLRKYPTGLPPPG